MIRLQSSQFEIARPIFAELSSFNLSVAAVLAGDAPGEVWVDEIAHPQVGFAMTSEGHYLAGDARQTSSYAGLRKIIPPNAYLVMDSPAWETVLDQVWVNRAARRHPREHWRFHEQRLPHWRDLVPASFLVAPVDAELLGKKELKNHPAVAGWVEGWHSSAYFLQHGFGFCVLHGETIASWCLADCASGPHCEIGIQTDRAYRRRGLAKVAVAAAVEHCLANGFTAIGWHCLSSNTGSRAVAEKVGFVKARDYFACSSVLPAENAGDLTPAEYQDWAEHYEKALVGNLQYAYRAAEAWAMAGDTRRALANLSRLAANWDGRPEWLEDNWRFDSLRHAAVYQNLLAALRAKQPSEE